MESYSKMSVKTLVDEAIDDLDLNKCARRFYAGWLLALEGIIPMKKLEVLHNSMKREAEIARIIRDDELSDLPQNEEQLISEIASYIDIELLKKKTRKRKKKKADTKADVDNAAVHRMTIRGLLDLVD